MDEYLENHFKGKYRVLPHLDQDTNNFVKDAYGVDNDPSFADFYIPCKSKIEIRHGAKGTSQLWCLIPNKSTGIRILSKIYKDQVNDQLPIEITREDKKYANNLCKGLIDNKILIEVEVLDFEVYFVFKVGFIDYLESIVKPKTKGCDIPPLNNKNLPKSTYVISENDMLAYKESIENKEMLEIKRANDIFFKLKKLNRKECKDLNMKSKEFFHMKGLWNEYFNFLKSYTKEKVNEL